MKKIINIKKKELKIMLSGVCKHNLYNRFFLVEIEKFRVYLNGSHDRLGLFVDKNDMLHDAF